MITNTRSSLNNLIPIKNTLFYYNNHLDRKPTATLCSNEHTEREGASGGTGLNRKHTSPIRSNKVTNREGKTGGPVLSSELLALRLKIYREGPQRVFQKIYAFNLSWLNRNTYTSRAVTQDVFDHLLIQWKDYEESVTNKKKELNKCKPVASLETTVSRNSTILTITSSIIFVPITAALFYICNSRKMYFAQTMNDLPVQHHKAASIKHFDPNISVCEEICYPDYPYAEVFDDIRATVDITIEPDMARNTNLNKIVLTHFAEEDIVSTMNGSNKELMHFADSDLVDTIDHRNIDIHEYLHIPATRPEIRLTSFAASCRDIFFLLC